MRIAMVSEHASPLATLGDVDAGGQNVHVAALSLALAERGHDVEVYTRRDSPTIPARVPFGPGVDVIHVSAGPARPLPKDELLPHMAEFGRRLADSWAGAGAPDLVHAHFWMSGLAAIDAARTIGVPVVQTFHALGTVKQRHQGQQDSSPRERIAAEAGICRDADLIIATCSDEVTELRRMGATDASIMVVPCGVDTQLFTPGTARAGHREAPILLSVGRLVERKGIDTIIRALVRAAWCRACRRRWPGQGRTGNASGSHPVARAGRNTRRRWSAAPAGQRRARPDAGAAAAGRPGRLHAVVRTVRNCADRGGRLRTGGRRICRRWAAGHRRARHHGDPGATAGPGRRRVGRS